MAKFLLFGAYDMAINLKIIIFKVNVFWGKTVLPMKTGCFYDEESIH